MTRARVRRPPCTCGRRCPRRQDNADPGTLLARHPHLAGLRLLGLRVAEAHLETA